MPAPASLTEVTAKGSKPENNGMLLDQIQKAALIVTFFPKSRLTPPDLNVQSTTSSGNGDQDETKTTRSSLPSYVSSFTSLLAQLVPHFDYKSTQLLTSHITQSTYAGLYQDLPDFSNTRHDDPIRDFERKHDLEIIFDVSPNTSGHQQRPLRLALFDMDSTLINEEVIDELARSIGISDAVSAITARAMNGDIDFATSLSERVAMLKGVRTNVWEDLKKTVTIATGAKELVSGLKEKGVLTGVVSGGFIPMAEWLKGELGLDVAVANHLLEEGPTADFPYPHLSGLLDPNYRVVTPELKRETLKSLAADHAIPMSETLAVGDGSNDLLMLGTAGLGIAWNAKEKVQIRAPMRLNGNSLADVLYLIF
ncbi:MAG: hypothetical protein Q9161_007495 [Pseudevernia consocians]